MTESSIRSFAERREIVLARIGEAAARAGRDPAGVTLVAVSKTHPAEVVQAAIDAGLTVLGENRVQEAVDKAAATRGGTWHLIGPLRRLPDPREDGLPPFLERADGRLSHASSRQRLSCRERRLDRSWQGAAEQCERTRGA